jgi:glycosyltransferase involved in cell wall biosynthesis
MSRIAIVALSVSARDAVGHDVLQMQRLLSAGGHEVALFSSHWFKPDPNTQDISQADAFLGDDPSAVLIYHHAIGWSAAVELVRRAACVRVVRYHNVTPARFFAGCGGGAAKLCWQGREELRLLAQPGCDLYLSASAYNQGELVRAGADPGRCRVLPPFHQVDRMLAAAPDGEVLRACRDAAAINLLFVGRQAPNKGHRFLIEALAALAGHYEPRSRLLLVGREEPSLVAYGNQLRDQARRLGVHDRVVFISEASEAALRAYYEASAALVVTSEHEGFCVPVVEAMALGVPLVAWGTSAIPETVGEAGLVWDEPDPFLLAESIACLAGEPAVRQRLAERGRRRFAEHFSNARIAERFAQALTSCGTPLAA